MLQLKGQFAGNQVTFAICDFPGTQIGYGNGMVTDATHINVTSGYLNGAVSGYTTFHIKRAPQ